MAGVIYQFGTTTLPGATATWQVDAAAQDNITRTLGGVYDPSGTDTAELALTDLLTVTAKAYAATQTALGASLDTYRALLGKRDRLWLDPFDVTQTNRWCWARCVRVNETNAYNNRITQPITLVFKPLTGWQGHAYGGAWNLDAGYLFDSGLWFDGTGATAISAGANAIVLPNAGNRTCTNVGISLTAGNANITGVTFAVADLAQFSWAGTLAATNTLRIDCGARRVIGGAGLGAYSGFALGANHYTPYWLPLLPGSTTVTLTLAGGGTGATVQFSYADCWN